MFCPQNISDFCLPSLKPLLLHTSPVDSPSDHVFYKCLNSVFTLLIQTFFVSYMDNCNSPQLGFSVLVFPWNHFANNWNSGLHDYSFSVSMPWSSFIAHAVPYNWNTLSFYLIDSYSLSILCIALPCVPRYGSSYSLLCFVLNFDHPTGMTV